MTGPVCRSPSPVALGPVAEQAAAQTLDVASLPLDLPAAEAPLAPQYFSVGAGLTFSRPARAPAQAGDRAPALQQAHTQPSSDSTLPDLITGQPDDGSSTAQPQANEPAAPTALSSPAPTSSTAQQFPTASLPGLGGATGQASSAVHDGSMLPDALLAEPCHVVDTLGDVLASCPPDPLRVAGSVHAGSEQLEHRPAQPERDQQAAATRPASSGAAMGREEPPPEPATMPLPGSLGPASDSVPTGPGAEAAEPVQVLQASAPDSLVSEAAGVLAPAPAPGKVTQSSLHQRSKLSKAKVKKPKAAQMQAAPPPKKWDDWFD